MNCQRDHGARPPSAAAVTITPTRFTNERTKTRARPRKARERCSAIAPDRRLPRRASARPPGRALRSCRPRLRASSAWVHRGVRRRRPERRRLWEREAGNRPEVTNMSDPRMRGPWLVAALAVVLLVGLGTG